MTLSTSV